MARGVGEVLLLCVLSRNSRKTGLIVRLWPRKQGSYCAWCQGTRLWHHFPSSRAASFWVDLYFILPQRMVLYSYSENGNAQQVSSFSPPPTAAFRKHVSSRVSSWNGFEIRSPLLHSRFHVYPLPSLSHTLNTSFLFSFMQGFMQGFMPALYPQAFAYFLEKPLCLCCLRCRRNLSDVRFFEGSDEVKLPVRKIQGCHT